MTAGQLTSPKRALAPGPSISPTLGGLPGLTLSMAFVEPARNLTVQISTEWVFDQKDVIAGLVCTERYAAITFESDAGDVCE